MGTPEEKIILATINCIEKYGREKTTIRLIGKEAGMNSASINYYFRSKDVLMTRVMEIALGNAFDLDNFKESIGLPIRERLVIVMDGMLAGAQKYPKMARAFFSDLFFGMKHNAQMPQRCNAFLDVMKKEIEAAYPQKPAKEISMAIMAIASATFLFPGLFPGFFTFQPHPDLLDEKQRKVYVCYVVDTLLRSASCEQ